jgi:hypothetical protein
MYNKGYPGINLYHGALEIHNAINILIFINELNNWIYFIGDINYI